MSTSDFRITHQTVGRRAVQNLQQNLARMGELQDQISSMKRIRKPSDSPVEAISSLRLRSDIGRSEQITRNIDDALGWLGTQDSALTAVVEQIQRVRELAIQGRNGALDAAAREAVATEVDKLRETILGLANTKFGDRAVFAGTANGLAYDSAATYTGVSNAVERTIAPGVRLQVNVNGDDVFGSAGNDIFGVLTQIATSLRTDPSQLDAQVATLDTHTRTIQTKLVEVGARFKRVESMKDFNDAGALTLRQNLSQVEDIDLAKTIMELQLQETAYQAALQSTARVIQPSLVDFLR